MEKLNNLKSYIIKRFIAIIILLSIVEYVNMSFIRHTLLKLLVDLYFKGQSADEVTSYGVMAGTIFILILIVLEILTLLLPRQIQPFIEKVIINIRTYVAKLLMHSGGKVSLENVTFKQELLLFLLLISIVFLILIPLVVAALYFSALVLKQFKAIEEEEHRKQKEFDKRRNLMLSDIAHDLRTPITTVSGYAMALSDGMVEEEKKQEYLDAIQAKSKRMSDLISLLFDYVKLDSDGFTLNKGQHDVCELVRECAAFQYQDIEDANMTLEVDIPEEQYMMNLDKLQFSRVVTNLLTNAVRHNSPGTDIGLFVDVDEDEIIRIMVADNGELIPEEQVQQIFDPFVMGDESRNSKGGTGLGLSISKKIVEMHGYKIKLVQQPDVSRISQVEQYQKAFIITMRR